MAEKDISKSHTDSDFKLKYKWTCGRSANDCYLERSLAVRRSLGFPLSYARTLMGRRPSTPRRYIYIYVYIYIEREREWLPIIYTMAHISDEARGVQESAWQGKAGLVSSLLCWLPHSDADASQLC